MLDFLKNLLTSEKPFESTLNQSTYGHSSVSAISKIDTVALRKIMKGEIRYDSILVILVVIPILTFNILSFFCSGWNEGSMHGTCTVSLFEPLYDFLNGVVSMLAFGGFLFYAPFVLVAYVGSTRSKIKRLLLPGKEEYWRPVRDLVGAITWVFTTYIILYLIIALWKS